MLRLLSYLSEKIIGLSKDLAISAWGN